MADISNKTIAQLLDYIENAEKELKNARQVIRQIEEEKAKSYQEIPGIEGVYDGTHMTADDGQKYEVPANYAAKSRLVYGDRLKKIEENGATLFKQIVKVPRKKIQGILNKKEGMWYIITDAGSYKIADVAAEFNHAELHDEAEALIPESDANAPFAALDKILTQRAPIIPPMHNRSVSNASGAQRTAYRPAPQPSSSVPQATADKPRRAPRRSASTADSAAAPRRTTPQFGGQPSHAPAARVPQPANKEFISDLKEPNKGDSVVSLKDIGDDDLR